MKKNNLYFLSFLLILSFTFLSCKKKGNIKIDSVESEITNCSLPYYVNFNVVLTYQEGDIEFHWDFGDGSFSEDKDPVHVYTQTGAYIVTLTITNYEKTEVETLSIDIQNQSIPIISDFDYEILDNNYAPAELTFTNKSKYASNFFWNFGDLLGTTDFEPIHTFENSGIFDVTLSAICSNGDTAKYTEQIEILPPPADIFIKSVNVWLPNEHLNKELELKIYYDIFDETPSLLSNKIASQIPVLWTMYEEIYFFSGIYDSELLKFEIWDSNYYNSPIYTFAITTSKIAELHYPALISFNDGNGYSAEVGIEYVN